MFFNSGAGTASFGLGVSAHLRAGLLAGTILGAGTLMLLPGAARAQNYVYTGPASTGTAVTSAISGSVSILGTGTVTITTTAGGTVTAAANGYSNGAVVALSGDGDIALNLGDTVTNTGVGTIVFARSVGAGSISLTGAGNFIGNAYGLRAETDTGAITLGGTGSVSAGDYGGAVGILASIGSAAATSDILINRSGAITGFIGVDAKNEGSGKITIQGIGAVNATSVGINSSAQSGATLIDLTNNVTSTAETAVFATSTTGAITIKTASGVAVSSGTGAGMTGIKVTSSAGGNIDIGGADGLGGAVSGATGISASTTGAGTINVKTASGGTVTASNGNGIQTTAVDGATVIDLGANVSGTGADTYGVSAEASGAGSISLTGAGDISGDASGIYALTRTGAITIGGTGKSTSSTSAGISAIMGGFGTTSDILVNRSGAITGNIGVVAQNNNGSGKITIQGIGTVNATSVGIKTDANSGATLIDLTNNVTSTGAIAISTASNSGAITIKTASGVAISGDTIGIRVLSFNGGAIDIGGAAGLGGAVSGRDVGAISARTTGAGTVAVKTASGGNIIGGLQYAINTEAVNGATTIAIGAGSTVTGLIQTTTTNGNVVANNAGTVNGSLNAVLSTGGTGTFTFNNSGTLALVGSQANTGFAINNLSGGVLTGTGSFGDVNAAAGSIIRAGDRTLSPVNGVPVMGTLNATSLTLASGAIVDVRADYSGVADKVAVTGTAALNGATLNIKATPKIDATWVDKKTFTVLTANNVTGTFANITTDYAFLKFTAAYTGTDVSVTSDRNWTSFGSYARTGNQKSVSDVFDKFQTDVSNPVINRVTTLTTSQATNALAQMSGTGLAITRTQSFAASSVFSGAINSEMGKFTSSAGGGSSVLSYAQDTKIKSKAFDKIAPKQEAIADGRVWAHVLGGIGNMKADGANPAERATNYGLAAGADTALTPNLRAGFALSLGQSATRINSLATKADATWGQGALYAVATDGDLYGKAALVYGRITTDSERVVTAFGTQEKATGKFDSNLVSARLEVGRKFRMDAIGMTPFAAFEPSWLMQDSYSEKGPSSITLGFDKTVTRAMPATLGLKFDADYAMGDLRMMPSATIGWVHNFADATTISPFFTALPGSNFTVAGAKGDRNLARTELNVEATPIGSLATFYLNTRADFGARTSAVRGTAGVMMRF